MSLNFHISEVREFVSLYLDKLADEGEKFLICVGSLFEYCLDGDTHVMFDITNRESSVDTWKRQCKDNSPILILLISTDVLTVLLSGLLRQQSFANNMMETHRIQSQNQVSLHTAQYAISHQSDKHSDTFHQTVLWFQAKY